MIALVWMQPSLPIGPADVPTTNAKQKYDFRHEGMNKDSRFTATLEAMVPIEELAHIDRLLLLSFRKGILPTVWYAALIESTVFLRLFLFF